MSITRLQQARQMYAMGQRVAKTLDGSRPGYRGSDMGSTGSSTGSSGPAGGASAGGNYGGNSSGGTPPGGMSNTGGNQVDVGFQNAIRNEQIRQDTIKNQNNPNFGQFFGTRVPTYSAPTFGQKVSNVFGGIGDYIKGGGLIGAGIRGITGLVNKFTGPKATEYGNLDIPGYNMLNIAGPVVGPTPTEGGDGGDNQQLYVATNQYPIMGNTSEEGIETLVNNPDFLQRFRVKNPYRQDKEGQLDPAIIEMINKLYT